MLDITIYKEKFKPVLLLIFLLLSSSLIYSNRVKNLDINNGLAHLDVLCILQDEAGYMWIGTGNGLQRYDGYELKSYHDDIEKIFISTRIYSMVLQNEILWITSKSGLLCFNTASETYLSIRCNYNFKNKSIFIKNWNALKNQLWIIADSRLFLATYTIENKSIVVNIEQQSIPGIKTEKDIQLLEHDENHNFWISTAGETSHYYFHDNRFILIDSFNTPNLKELHYNPWSKELWMASFGAIRRNSYEESKPLKLVNEETVYLLDELNLKANPIITFNLVNNNIWIGTANNGLYEVNQLFPKINIINWYHTNNSTTPLTANGINDLFLSKDNCLWVALNKGGLDIIDLNKKQFNSLGINNNSSYLKSNILKLVTNVYEDVNSNLWIGTKNSGLFLFDKKTSKISQLQDLTTPNNVSLKSILDIDGFQNLVYVTATQGFLVYNIDTKKHFFFQRNNPRYFNYKNNVSSIAVDRNNYVWMGLLSSELQKASINVNGEISNVQKFSILPASVNRDPIKHITNIIADTARNELIVTDEKMLYRLFLNNKSEIIRSIPYQIKPGGNNLPDGVTLWDTKRQNDSVFWIGSIGNGLLKVILSDSLDHDGFGKNKCAVFSSNTSPFESHVQGILVDKNENIWYTSNGISHFNTKNKQHRRFDVGDGLTSNGFMAKTGYKSQNGTLYFGSTNGVVYFHPDSIKTNKTQPLITISNLYVNQKHIRKNEPVNCAIIFNGRQICLKHYQ
ncbi:MAG: hypothetical protein MI922_30690, partial [Bacteroidales bacterium]|nr:hypothetical protein [Bacteroidales bacterium]